MTTILLMVVVFLGYVTAYHTYGRFLAKKIFRIADTNKTPAEAMEDGQDYVPTRKSILFGHHFTSIAGTGPIVGPAIGVIWGWLPAMLWVFFGSIFMGAVHDFGALVVSLRNQGKSISECTARYIRPRVRLAFFLVVFLELLMVIAVFGLVIALIFQMFPEAVAPVWLQIPISVGLGWFIYKKGANLAVSTAVAVAALYLCMVLGWWLPFRMPAIAGMPDTGVWTVILLIYAFIASTLPVTVLLQPRDYINAWQLVIAMVLLALGVLASGLFSGMVIVAPAINPNVPDDAPSMWPFLFITIACGAVSGFHSLVSSGTSAKQLARETDAQFVAYGSMLTEGMLATLVIIAVTAGIGLGMKVDASAAPDGAVHAQEQILTGAEAWQQNYKAWGSLTSNLRSKLNAVVAGSANMIQTLRVPKTLGMVLIGVFIASFAGTTLDSATRIQRYIIAEIMPFKALRGKYIATLIAVVTAGSLAFASGTKGVGAMNLWPMFGGINQLLAALVLLLITIYLRAQGGWTCLSTGIPAVFMLCITLWSVSLNELLFIQKGKQLLSVINGATLVLAVWITIEVVLVLVRKKEAVE